MSCEMQYTYINQQHYHGQNQNMSSCINTGSDWQHSPAAESLGVS